MISIDRTKISNLVGSPSLFLISAVSMTFLLSQTQQKQAKYIDISAS
jgi:hypothetical protein